ncbi:MAG: hypothetical protein QM305_13410 [Bacteroidota bacterium]|nr:hypothetical protein [Bacteroidota bacterium]
MNDYKSKNRDGTYPVHRIEVKPTKVTLEVIKQFARCCHTKRELPLPNNTFIIN